MTRTPLGCGTGRFSLGLSTFVVLTIVDGCSGSILGAAVYERTGLKTRGLEKTTTTRTSHVRPHDCDVYGDVFQHDAAHQTSEERSKFYGMVNFWFGKPIVLGRHLEAG